LAREISRVRMQRAEAGTKKGDRCYERRASGFKS
jgi:hypothetical protein